MKKYLSIWMLLSLALTASAATYYVRTDGTNTNVGTTDGAAGAWRTIQYAVTNVAAGDSVYVRDGTYDERVTLGVLGSAGNFINFVGNASGTGVVMYGFNITDKSYVRLIGFEIRHTSTTYQRGIALGGNTHHLEILDNYIHDTHWSAISCVTGCSANNITIRGNRIYWVCHPGTLADPDGAIIGNYTGGNTYRWTVEYNELNRPGDGLNVYGTNCIIRNNWIHASHTDYWITGGFHFDGFQTGSDGAQTYCRNHIVENNFVGDIRDTVGPDGHFGIWQDTIDAGDTNVLLRGNVGYEVSTGGIGVIGVGGMRTYNNTFYRVSMDGSGGIITFYSAPNPGGLVANLVIYDKGVYNTPIYVDPPSDVTLAHNLGYLAATHPSYVSTADPLFIDHTNQNFRIQSGSPARDAGTNVIWITSASSSGTSFDVNNGQLLFDGYGTVEGDRITTGGTTTRITGISGSTVTVAATVTWTNLQPVYWLTDTTPDIGALPYGSTELTAATLNSSGTTYTVTPTGDARGVWFYTNGIPSHFDYDSPYSATLDGTVTAKAYALYAQADPVVLAGAGVASTNRATATTLRANNVIFGL